MKILWWTNDEQCPMPINNTLYNDSVIEPLWLWWRLNNLETPTLHHYITFSFHIWHHLPPLTHPPLTSSTLTTTFICYSAIGNMAFCMYRFPNWKLRVFSSVLNSPDSSPAPRKSSSLPPRPHRRTSPPPWGRPPCSGPAPQWPAPPPARLLCRRAARTESWLLLHNRDDYDYFLNKVKRNDLEHLHYLEVLGGLDLLL